MIARFTPSEHGGGRILLVSGQVAVGAVFHPAGKTPWRWRIFQLGERGSREGKAKSETEAKNALLGAWLDWRRQAGLKDDAA